MKIAQIPRRFVRHEWGGTETVVLETCRRLLQRGHETEILCPNALADSDTETIQEVSVRRFPYFYPYLGLRPEARALMDKKGGNLFSFPLLQELLRVPDLDIIHLHTLKRVGGIGRYAALRRNIPYVVTLHGGVHDVPAVEAATFTEPTRGTLEWGRALGWWVGSNRVLTDAAAILCVGETERRATQERYPDRRVEFLPNGVDALRFAKRDIGDGRRFRERHGIRPEAFVLLTVGRIDPQKNQCQLVRLLPKLRQLVPEAHLLLIGPVTNAGYREQIEREAAQTGMAEHVTLIPGLDSAGTDLVDAYHSADLFVLPSIHEPFGIVILEAWAAGKAVVASRVGGIPAFVEDAKDAALVSPDNDVELIEAIHGLSQNPDRRHSFACAGQHKAATQYDWDRITQRLVHLYSEVRSAHTRR
ncbi:MAG: hypothetical protein OHK0029_12410 [Armatimonadaceae bacterium]